MSKKEPAADVDVGAGYENLDELIAKSNPQLKPLPSPVPKKSSSSISLNGKASKSESRRDKSDSSSTGPVSHMSMPPAKNKTKSQSIKLASHRKTASISGSLDTDTNKGKKAVNKGGKAANQENKAPTQVNKSNYKIEANGEKKVDPQIYESMVRFICDYYMDTKKAFLVTGILTIFIIVLPLILNLIWLKFAHSRELMSEPTYSPTNCVINWNIITFVEVYPYSQTLASTLGVVVGVFFMLISIYFPRKRPLLMVSIIISFVELISFLFAFTFTIGYFIAASDCVGTNDFWVQPSISLTYEVFCSIWSIFCIILGIKVWKLKKKGVEELKRYKEGMP